MKAKQPDKSLSNISAAERKIHQKSTGAERMLQFAMRIGQLKNLEKEIAEED
jgi:hypothetical protein